MHFYNYYMENEKGDAVDKSIAALLSEYDNIVLLGEAGSGKSELGLQLACDLAEHYPERSIELFDLDQTKPLFRSRDVIAPECNRKFTIHFNKQIMDSPTAAGGIGEAIEDENRLTILDVGGGKQGAVLIGPYKEQLEAASSVVLYIVNPYRAFSSCIADVEETQAEILTAIGMLRVIYVANPNCGPGTTIAEIQEGYRRIIEDLKIRPAFAGALDKYSMDPNLGIPVPLLGIRLRLATSQI